MGLKIEIADWDGKSADDIAKIHARYENDAGFVEQLLDMLEDEALQSGASWLLKASLENGASLSLVQTKNLFSCLPALKHWSARLHVLQCFPYLSIPDASEKLLDTFLRNNLIDNNKFVRAWSYNGFAELSRKNPNYKKEAEKIFEMAMRDEAASVKARIRKIYKAGF